jgi:hypothetical protein
MAHALAALADFGAQSPVPVTNWNDPLPRKFNRHGVLSDQLTHTANAFGFAANR